METLVFSLRALSPVVFLALLGIFLRRDGSLPDEANAAISRLTFNLFLPCTIFVSAAKAELHDPTYLSMSVYAILCMLALVALMCVVYPRVTVSRLQTGAIICGSFRANIIILGIALMQNLYGSEGAACMAIIAASLAPLFNIASIAVLKGLSVSDNGNTGFSIKMIFSAFLSPLSVAAILGILCSLFGWRLPDFAGNILSSLGACATPLALILMGTQFEPLGSVENLRLSLLAIAVKNIILPLIGTSGAILLGFRGTPLCCIFLAFGAPTSGTSVIVTQNMGFDGKLASEIALFSSALALVTIFAGVSILKGLRLV